MKTTIFHLVLFSSLGAVISFPFSSDNIAEEVDNVIDETATPEVIDSNLNGSIFGYPDSKTGEMLSQWTPESGINPEEVGSYLEGDILIPKGSGRNGLVAQSSRWPGGVMPFVIDGSFNAYEMDVIERGIKEYHAKTCLRLKPRTNERDYVAIVNGHSGCWSSVGRVGGRQEVNFQTPACLSKIGTFIHEIMHAFGFYHEQNRYDRDTHVTIKYENISPGTTANFDKTPSSKAHAFGVSYDYGSVMHYSAYAFSRNGNPTIIPKESSGRNRMGQRNGFSNNDVQKLNKMYNCRGGGGQTWVRGSSEEREGPEDSGRPSVQPVQPVISPQPSQPSPGPSRPSRLPQIIGAIGSLVSNVFGGIFGEEANNTELASTDVPLIDQNQIGQKL